MKKENIAVGQYRMFLLLLALLVLMTFILPTGQNAFAYPVPDTGQTRCYKISTAIACPSPGQSFYGQDAQYGTNPRSYTKLDGNGDGLANDATSWTMVRDNVTGLVWEMKTDDDTIHDKDKTFTWCDTDPATNGGNQGTCGTGTGDAATDTQAFINALNSAHYGGYSDWRMPTIKELSVLVNSNIPYPGPTIDTAWFPNTMSSNYWSSTTFVSINKSLRINFSHGGIGEFDKSSNFTVRAVRGEQTSNNLVDNGDGTVTDTSTGLMWQKATAPGTYKWEEALAYCENLDLAGHSDWRLPNIRELQSLVDYSRYQPAIDPLLASDTVLDRYWSSTTNAYNENFAYPVEFHAGFYGDHSKGYYVYVRALRSEQALSFNFIDQTEVVLNTSIESNAITVTGITAPVSISITGGEYSVSTDGGSTWSDFSTTVPATVNLNDQVRVRQTSSSSYSTTTNTTLIIGGVSDTFSVITIYNTPDTFTFTDQTGVSLNTSIESNAITVTGITWPVSISITGGEYSVSTDGGSTWSEYSTSVPATVSLNDQVRVRQTSPSSYSTKTNTVLTIGGVSDTFSVTTLVSDTTPDQFTFTDLTDVALNSIFEASITVSGITAPTPISIVGNIYCINGPSWWTNANNKVNNGDIVTVRNDSSASYSTTTNVTLTIGGVSDTFSVTTLDDKTPDAFTFIDQTEVALNTFTTSNVITVTGINAAASISITGGKYSISTNGGSTWGSWTNLGGTVALNNQVKVRQTSSISPSVTTDATLTIGGVSDTFSVTTKSESALGTITIIPEPDSLNAPWTLTGPNAFSHSFNGDAVEGYLDPGKYTVTWGNVTGWDTPAAQTQTLAAGDSITFTGTYQLTPVIPKPPTSGTQGRNITINGSKFGAQGSGYVDFNGVRGTIVSWSDTQIVVTVPYGSTAGCMTIVTDYGTSNCIGFSVENPACFPPVKLSNYDYFNVVQDAYDNVTDGNTVLLHTGTFSENLLFNRDISTILQGGYNCSYDSNPGYTTIKGSLTITNGTVAVEKLIITSTANVAPTYTISGTVSGAVQSGVIIKLIGTSSYSTNTNSSGNYSFSNLINGNYTLTASKTGYSFTPVRSVTVNGGNVTGQNFTATANPTYTISGNVSGDVVSGVTMTLTGASSSFATTDGSGNYIFTGAANGSYIITPSMAGYTFSPTRISATVNNANVTGQNFTATELSSEKAITAFSLNEVAGTINETEKTIAVTMPFGTSVTALLATFTTTGASVKVGSLVQISGSTSNNFTTPVTYTVTAADGTSVNYTVTVTVAPASDVTWGDAEGHITFTVTSEGTISSISISDSVGYYDFKSLVDSTWYMLGCTTSGGGDCGPWPDPNGIIFNESDITIVSDVAIPYFTATIERIYSTNYPYTSFPDRYIYKITGYFESESRITGTYSLSHRDLYYFHNSRDPHTISHWQSRSWVAGIK